MSSLLYKLNLKPASQPLRAILACIAEDPNQAESVERSLPGDVEGGEEVEDDDDEDEENYEAGQVVRLLYILDNPSADVS